MWNTSKATASDPLPAVGAPGSEPDVPVRWLEPLLVRGIWGRVGSTLLMQLLGSSPEIAFDRAYPCENRCLASLLRFVEPLSGRLRVPNGYWMDDPDHLWWADPASYGFDVTGIPLSYPQVGVDRKVLHREAVVGAWQAYSKAQPWPGERRPRYYAEKYAGFAPDLDEAGIGYRWIDLVRDPRDVWCSVLAFDRKRGFFGFGRREEQSEDTYLSSFLQAVRRRMEEMAGPATAAPAVTVRYEDLVSDLAGEAARLSTWLGVELSADLTAASTSDLAEHRTAPSTDESIGRWKVDLPPEVVRRIEGELGPHLERYRYEPSG